MIQGRLVSEQKDLILVKDIIMKELPSQEFEHYENEAGTQDNVKGNKWKEVVISALVYEGSDYSCPVAAGTMMLKPENATITAVAVLKPYRRKQYGDFVMRILIDRAKTAGIHDICVKCPENVTGFFHKLHFEKIGEPYKNMDDSWYVMKHIPSNTNKCCGII